MVHLFPFSVLVVVTEEALRTLSHGRVPAFYVPEVHTSHLLFMGLSLCTARGGGDTFQRPSLASSCIGITGRKTTSAPGLHRESFVVNQMSAQVSLFVCFFPNWSTHLLSHRYPQRPNFFNGTKSLSTLHIVLAASRPLHVHLNVIISVAFSRHKS